MFKQHPLLRASLDATVDETAQRLASIVEFSEDAIIGKNIDGVITDWNRAAEKMYGYTKAEVVGRDLSLVFPSERHSEIPAIMERILSGQPIVCMETQRLNKAGSRLDVSVSISPIKGATGPVTGASAESGTFATLRSAKSRKSESNTWLTTTL
jgi:PAS domain S-box-containing protein